MAPYKNIFQKMQSNLQWQKANQCLGVIAEQAGGRAETGDYQGAEEIWGVMDMFITFTVVRAYFIQIVPK